MYVAQIYKVTFIIICKRNQKRFLLLNVRLRIVSFAAGENKSISVYQLNMQVEELLYNYLHFDHLNNSVQNQIPLHTMPCPPIT